LLRRLRVEVERVMCRTRALGIMGKAPEPGRVKTRLIPPLDAEQATLLYRAFLRDAMLTGLMVEACSVSVIYPPSCQLALLDPLLPAGVSRIEQAGNGLGEGLQSAFQALWQAGARVVVLVGSDSPALPVGYIEEAFVTLERGSTDVVVGPADDGGYYLIGLRDDHPELFTDIAWSTDRVLAQTLQRANARGLRVHQTPPWYDVDDSASLDRLVIDLGNDPRLAAPATRAALQTIRRLGAPLPESPIPWTIRDRRRVFESPWRHLDVDRVNIHTGREVDYTYFTTPDAVWVVPVTPTGEIVFVRQYRHPVRDWCLEIPAGSVVDTTLEEAARRELREEVGATSEKLRFIGAFYSASAHLTLRGHVYLALDVALAEPELEETEMLVQMHIPAEIAFDMARRGEINEGESALAVLLCEHAMREYLRA
jgi:rSAM/selenodomain-associated transferase 1